MNPSLDDRAARHAALGDPTRLAIVDELIGSDRAPSELLALIDVPSNLLAHHLDVLEAVGVISRHRSAGDRRRRYVRLESGAFAGLIAPPMSPPRRALFICTHNSARSQLAAALWSRATGGSASSAGTHPADAVHPGAVAAAKRVGLDIAAAHPASLGTEWDADLVITVCDRAHEELPVDLDRLHWSIADPVPAGTRAAFDGARDEIADRIERLAPAVRPG